MPLLGPDSPWGPFMLIVTGLAGLVIITLVLGETFEALVLPRRVTRRVRFSLLYYRCAWRAWSAASNLFPTNGYRPTFLSVFGPLSLLVLFAIWAATLILAFGLIHYALTPERGIPDSLYLSGTTFTTLGYGDVTPTTTAGRVLAVVEAGTGFGYFAVVIGYLPVLYQAFGRREGLIALLDARAGSPPAAGRLLLRALPGDSRGGLIGFLAEAERWSAEVLEAHLSFPVLGYYRSQHDNQSWLAAVTCILDASALLLTIVDGASRAQARLTFAMARHTVVDLGLVLHRPLTPPVADRLPPARLADLVAALRLAGVVVRDDPEALAKLTELRGLYELFLVELGAYFRLEIPEMWPNDNGPDNWQTSAWMRRAGPLAALEADPHDDHFL